MIGNRNMKEGSVLPDSYGLDNNTNTKNSGNPNEFFPSAEDVGALVLDIGQLYVRAGYAGDDCPKHFSYSVTGEFENNVKNSTEAPNAPNDLPHPKLSRSYPVSFSRYQPNLKIRPCFYQSGKESFLEAMPTWESVSQPITPYEIDKDGFESILSHIFGARTGLNVELDGNPLLFVEPNKHNRKIREIITEIVFETFHVEALYAAKKAVLTAFAVGRSGGLVIDVGKESTSLSPVQEGYIVQNNILELPIGGDLVDYQLSSILKLAGLHTLTPSYKIKKTIRQESSESFSIESSTIDDSLVCSPSFEAYSQREVLRQMKEAVGVVSDDPIPLTHFSWFHDNAKSATNGLLVQKSTMPFQLKQRYTLPDGVTVHSEKLYGKVSECLFNFETIFGKPSTLPESFLHVRSLPEAAAKCVMGCDVDARRDLLAAVIISGGPTMATGFVERMTRQLQDSEGLFSHGVKYKVVSPSSMLEKPYLSWIGGSILASLNSFQEMWMSSAEYFEHGPSVMERICV